MSTRSGFYSVSSSSYEDEDERFLSEESKTTKSNVVEQEKSPPSKPGHSYTRKYSKYGKNKRNKSGEECIKEGYLMKQNGSFQRWKQTYFKIYPQQIYYAKNPSSSLFHEINVTEISIAETSVNNVNNSFKVITGQISLSLSAETRREMEEWVSSFKLASQREGRNLNELSETLSGDHHWYSCTHSRPTFCNVCRDTLPGVTIKGLSCEVCRYKVHKKCAAKAPKSCKWTTLDCIPPEERLVGVGNDEYAMPHQWLEGNITPGQKCIVCGKLCGSKRRMQDFMCLWCDTVVHGGSCKLQFQKRCSLGLNCLSVIPATTIKRAEHLGPGVWETIYHNRSPLIVFVNSKSGDNQGVKFMRRFKQLLNPAQVFDLSVAGPTLGVSMCKNFKQFRILVCGGDGSVGWVMTELDKQKLTNKCQIGVLPLGTGNDLARVFGWGSACYDVGVIPLVLQQLERARPSMLDRWAIMCKEFPSGRPEGDDISGYEDSIVMHITRMLASNQYEIVIQSAKWAIMCKRIPSGRPEGDDISGYEDSIVMHITRMLASNQYEIVIQSAKFLCETIRNFVELVGVASGSEASNVADLKLTSKCEVLQDKLTLLLRTLQIESEASSFLKSLDLTRRSSTMDNLDIMATLDGKKLKWHSDSELNTSMDSSRAKASGLGPGTDNAGFGQTKKTSKQKVFIPKEHLWSRANSLKKAMREIIDHTEKAVDEQNQQTSEAIAQCAAAVRSSNISTKGTHQPLSHILDDLPETIIDADEKDDTMEKGSLETESVKKDRVSATSPDGSPQHRNISAQDESDVMSDKAISKAKQDTKPISDKPSYPEYLSAPSSPFFNLKPDVFFAKNQKSSNTVVYPGTVIARAFQKPAVSDGFISKVLLANANAFCATALPGNEDEQDKLNNFKEKCVMNNYFGVGIDAKISLDFHNKREEHPEKCRSRTRNFIWYGVLGGMELINRTYRNLEQNVHLEVDGHKIHLPSLQGIVVLNIPSYMGGSNFWGTKKEVDGFVSPSFDDRMLEVVAVLGASQMGMSKVFGGMQHHRIAQCHTVKITITDEAVPVQVDGEAWMQPPGIVQIVHKNRAPMLMRDREFEETLRSWHERQVHKVDRMAEPVSTPEMCLIKPLAESVTSLVRSIKAASMINSVVQQELYQAASNLSALAEKVRNQEVSKIIYTL
ncbi:diacylglycerol kinase delta-like [Clytia hemisphaerica]|uniref:diacylglycerol kinase delta-like n=1 Tax=Clytia hemisphaerica TaxID=252671 RepID=UPI0034D78FDC